jgi:hypothetical protein
MDVGRSNKSAAVIDKWVYVVFILELLRTMPVTKLETGINY